MGLFKRILLVTSFRKEMVDSIFGGLPIGVIGFNELQIEGSEIIRNLPDTNITIHIESSNLLC
jgi:hypothetical protein